MKSAINTAIKETVVQLISTQKCCGQLPHIQLIPQNAAEDEVNL